MSETTFTPDHTTFRNLTRGWTIKAQKDDGTVDEMTITTDLSHFVVGGKVYATLANGTERSWDYGQWVNEYRHIQIVSKNR
jgi:hypothetical protein